MNSCEIMKVFEDTAHIRLGGRESEKTAARYLCERISKMGLEAHWESFEVPLGDIDEAVLTVDGKEIPCKGYMCCGCGDVEAPFYYLRDRDPYSLSCCKGKIVLVEGGVGYWLYQDILKSGAVGFVSHEGNVFYLDRDINQKELRSYFHNGQKLPAVSIHSKEAVELIRSGAKTAKIKIIQNEYTGTSQNVILDLPGEVDEYIVFSAHYDSTCLSRGAYDNMSGSIGLLALAEHFADHPHRYGVRFIWCGSEERGLLGAKAYCAAHAAELDKIVLDINLDMIGSIMGKFIACCSSEEKLVHYIEYFSSEYGMGVKAYQDVYSSDSTPFADNGVPSMTFARNAPTNTANIHNRYDTVDVIKAEQMEEDIRFITAFADRMANAALCPVGREIPPAVLDKLDLYMLRKKPSK